jgi:hypothetical protein
MTRPACSGLAWLLVLTGCSTSSDHGAMTAGAGGAGGASGGGKAGSTAAGGSGSVAEGKSCRTGTDCASGLNCVINVIEDVGFRHCARGCSKERPCMTDEMCVTATGSADDLYCRNQVTEAFKPCGPSDTSICAAPLGCIFSDVQQGVPVGTCFNLCQLPASKVTISDPTVLKTCPGALECVSALGDADVGVCSTTAPRGELCSLEQGKLCGQLDICVTDDVSGESRCYQDCSEDGMCSDGKPCTPIEPPVSICADPQ